MTDSANALYTAWLDLLPQAFRAMVPAADDATSGIAATASDAAAAPPFPTTQMGDALGVLDKILTQLYHGYLPLLANGGLTPERLIELETTGSDGVNRLLTRMAVTAAQQPLAGVSVLANTVQPWAALLQALQARESSATAGMAQLQLGMERTFGGLAEAFGLGPMRELRKAWQEMLTASTAKQRAQVEYLALVVDAWSKGTQNVLEELKTMGARGERIESLLVLIRLWAKSVDACLHTTMQETAGLEATAKVIRATTHQREQLQKAIGLASEALHVPTRKDMDDAFREIQELKRQVRRLKKAMPVAAQKKLAQAEEAA